MNRKKRPPEGHIQLFNEHSGSLLSGFERERLAAESQAQAEREKESPKSS